jgi:flavin reductase (DIM6/NTAB) family NADH-FMN oxidoreductase RutF
MADQGGIHEEHPFRAPLEERDPVRRFRGRLPAPVTIVTAGAGTAAAGLTVASIMIAEGEPARVYLLIGPTTDLFYAIESTDRFILHVGSQRHRETADVFAGLRPQPGGSFTGLTVDATEYGPELTDFENRLRAQLMSLEDASHSVLVTAAVDSINLEETADPLVWYRGAYRALS